MPNELGHRRPLKEFSVLIWTNPECEANGFSQQIRPAEVCHPLRDFHVPQEQPAKVFGPVAQAA